MRGVDAAIASAPKAAPIDPARVGISGLSYGGYLVMWAVATSDRFAAAVAGAGIANWQSYAGQNRVDDWLVPFFGAMSDYGIRAEPGSSPAVIDVGTRRLVAKVDLGAPKKPHGLAWLGSQDLAVTAEGSGELLIVKPREGKIVRVIPTGQQISHMVAVTPEGNRAFVANIGSGTVTAIDLQTGQKIQDLPKSG